METLRTINSLIVLLVLLTLCVCSAIDSPPSPTPAGIDKRRVYTMTAAQLAENTAIFNARMEAAK